MIFQFIVIYDVYFHLHAISLDLSVGGATVSNVTENKTAA